MGETTPTIGYRFGSVIGKTPIEAGRELFLPLAQELVGRGDAAIQLATDVALIAGFVQYPKLFDELAGGRTKNRERVERIASLAQELAEELDDLHIFPMLAISLRLPENESLSSEALRTRQLGVAAADLASAYKKGRPPAVFRDLAVQHLVRLTEAATGRPIRAGKGPESIDPEALIGPGGEFITRWFAIIDPGTGRTALVRSVRRARKALKDPSVLENDRNTFNFAQYLVLSGKPNPF